MPAQIHREPRLDNFEDEIKRMFGRTGVTMRFDQIEDNILRVGFRKRGMPELVVDLRQGPDTRFGPTIYEVTSSGKENQMYFYGAEAIGMEGKEVSFMGSKESFRNYVMGVFEDNLNIPRWGTMTPRERLSILRTFGYYSAPDEKTKYYAAGGVMNINVTQHWGRQLTDLLEGVTIRARERYMVNQTVTNLFNWGIGLRGEMVKHGRTLQGIDRMVAEIPGFMQAATAGERGRLVPIPGQLEFNEFGEAVVRGIGKAETIAKREPLLQREVNVSFIEVTPEGRIKVAQPGYITQREATGWRYPNLTVGGIEPVPMYYQPRVLQVSGGTASGSMLLRKEAWEGYQATENERWLALPEDQRVSKYGVIQRNRILGAGMEKGLKLEFPEISVRDLTKMQIIPGFFKRVEGGQYEHISDYTDMVLPAYSSAIVGLIKYRSGGKTITQEVTARTGAMPFYVPEGENFGLYLSMPQYYSPSTGEAVQFPGKKGRSTKAFADALLADAQEPGFHVSRTSSGEMFFELRGMAGVAPSLKGFAGGKIVIAPQATADARTLSVPIGEKIEQYWAVTADVKLATEWFQWSVFGGLPNTQQEMMLRELQYADPNNLSKQQAVNAMIKYMRGQDSRNPLPLVGGVTRIPDINVLAKIYSKETGLPAIMSGQALMEELRQTVMKLDPSKSMERYQVALLPAGWRDIGEHHVSDEPFLKQRYLAAFGNDWQKYVQLNPVPGRPNMLMESVYSWSVLGPVGSTLTAEYMSQDPRINMAGMRSLPEQVARELNVVPGMDVLATGIAPPAARAWRGVMDSISWWKSKMSVLPDYTEANKRFGDPYKTITLEELRATGIRSKLGPRTTPREISKMLTDILKEEPEMLIMPEGDIFPLPRLIDPLATYHYGMEEGMEEAVSRMGRTYSKALAAALSLGTTRSLAPIRNAASDWLEDVNRRIAGGKEVFKLTTSATPEVSMGGRYTYTQGMPFGIGVVSESTFQAALERRAQKLGIANRAEWMEKIYRQMRAMGGIPSFTIREPNVWEAGGATPAMLVTPRLLREKYGLDFPEGTQVYGMKNQQIIPGNPFFTGVVGALGLFTVGQQGDWDMDQMLSVMGIKVTAKGITATRATLAAAKQDPNNLIDFLLRNQRAAFGQGILEPDTSDITSAADVVVKSLADIKKGLLPGMKWQTMTTEAGTSYTIQVPESPEMSFGQAVQEASMRRAESKLGMAISHIQRTWAMAGGIAAGLSNEMVTAGVVGMASPYQHYLDYNIKEIRARGGFTPIEELFSTSVFSYNQDTKELSIYGMTRGNQGFARVASSYAALDVKGKPMQSGTFQLGITESLIWALQESGYTNKSLSFLVAQSPEMMAEIESRLEAGAKLSNIMLPGTAGNIWSRGGYDITKTPIGIAYYSDILRRNTRPGKQKEIVVGTDATGKEIKVPVTQIAREMPFLWQGKVIAFGELEKDPIYRLTVAVVQGLTNQGGPLPPEEVAYLGRLQAELERKGIEVPAQVKQITARYPVTEAVEEALTKQLTGAELVDKVVRSVMIQARDKGEGMTVRSSALPYFALEEYSDVGDVFGKHGAKTWNKIRGEQRMKLFMQRVLGISEENIDKIFPVSGKAKTAMESGKQFELEYVEAGLGGWSSTRLTGIEKEGWSKVTIGQLANFGPVSGIFQKLIADNPGIEDWGITGIPDIIRIADTGEAIVEEVKQITNYGSSPNETVAESRARESTLKATKAMSDQVRIQLATYLLGGLSTAAAGKKAFYAWVTPYIQHSQEFARLPQEEQGAFTVKTAKKLFTAFRKGVQGLETVGVRGGISEAESYKALSMDDLQGLSVLVAQGMEKAYRSWTEFSNVKDLFIEAVSLIKATPGIEISEQLARFIDDLPIEPKVTEDPTKLTWRATVKAAGRRREADPTAEDLVASAIREGKDPNFIIEAYFKTKATPRSTAEDLVKSSLLQVNTLRQQGFLDLPLQMYKELRAAQGGLTPEQLQNLSLPTDKSMIEVLREATPEQLGQMLKNRKDVIREAAKALTDVSSAYNRAGASSDIPGMDEVRDIVNRRGATESPGKQLTMGETLGLAKELQPLAQAAAVLTKSFTDLNKSAQTHAEIIMGLDKELGALQQKYAAGGYTPESPEGEALQAKAERYGAAIKLEGIRLQRAKNQQYQKILSEVGITEATAGLMSQKAEEDYALSKKETAAENELAKLSGGGGGGGGGGPVSFGGAISAKGASRFFRNLIGGWGLFYMGTLASWPARAMGYGLQEQEAMQAGMAQQVGAYVGQEAYQPYQQVAYDIARSKMFANAGGAATFQRMQAQVPGVARQIGGVAMGGVAGLALGSYLMSAATPVLGTAAAAAISPIVTGGAALIGLGVAAALNIQGNAQLPQQATISTLADRTKFGADSYIGGLSEAWNIEVPYYLGGWKGGRGGLTIGDTLRYGLIASDKTRTPSQQARLAELDTKRGFGPLSWGMSIPEAVPGIEAMTKEFLTGEAPTKDSSYAAWAIRKASTDVGDTRLYQQQLPAIAARTAMDARFSSYDPNLVTSAAIRVYASGGGFQANTAQAIENIVKAESIGIPIQQLGQQYTSTFRQRYTAANAGKAEQWASTIPDIYAAAETQTALQFLAQAPVSYQRRTLGGGKFDWQTQAIARAKDLMLTPEGEMWAQAGNEAAIAEGMGQEYFTPTLTPLRGMPASALRQQNFRGLRQQQIANQVTRAATDAGINGTLVTQLSTMVRTGGPIQVAQAERAISAAQSVAALGIDPNQYNLASSMSVQGNYLTGLQTNVGAIVEQQLGTNIGIATFTRWTQPGGPMATVRDAQMTTQAFQQNPFRLTDIAMQQPVNAANAASFSMKYATGDISSKTGRQTGLSWGTSGLRRGSISAFEMGMNIWGAPTQTSPWGAVASGMTTGYMPSESPQYGMLFGEQAYQQMQSDAGFNYTMGQIGFQEQSLALQNQYIPQFRAIQTQQMQAQYATTMRGFDLSMAAVGVQVQQIQLGHRQFQEQMALQQAQFNLQGVQFGEQQGLQRQQFFSGQALQQRQFGESMALQQRQAYAQRSWTQQDWQYQQNVREMQWGWRQQDFQESVRFTTGRDRRLAERQMQRETTMYGMEGEQIDKQKKRQQEIWKMEDEHFQLQKKQAQEQLDLAKKNFIETQELQKKHFDEQRVLQQKSMDMQKRHEEERYKLSLAAAGVQAAQIANAKAGYQEQYELGMKLRDLQWEYEDKQRKLQETQLAYQKTYVIEQKKREDEYLEFTRKQAEYAGTTALALSDMNTFVADLTLAVDNIQGKINTLKTAVQTFNWGNIWTFIQNLLGIGGGGGSTPPKPQTGAIWTVPPGYPNDSYTMQVSTGETVIVMPTDKGVRTNKSWNNIIGNMFTYPSSSTGRSGGGGGSEPIVLIINIANQRLGKYVIDRTSQELEVR